MMGNRFAEKRLLSTGEVARLSGFSPSAVLQWIHAGKLRSYSSPGGQHRIAPDELLAFLEQHGMRIPPELRASGKRRVLVVEDDRAVREVLVRILTVSGLSLEVEGADGGIEGCVKLATFKPHLIVLDTELPGFDGVELCRWVKESDPFAHTAVLLLASDPNDEGLRVAMLAGADEWMIKPVRVMPFLNQVTRLLELDLPQAGPALREAAAALTAGQDGPPPRPAARAAPLPEPSSVTS
jgi:excisionase family DNA binding protein